MEKTIEVIPSTEILHIIHNLCGGREQLVDYIPSKKILILVCAKCGRATPFDVKDFKVRTESILA